MRTYYLALQHVYWIPFRIIVSISDFAFNLTLNSLEKTEVSFCTWDDCMAFLAFLYLQFFPKANEKLWHYYKGTLSRIIFVCFLGELTTPKRHFKHAQKSGKQNCRSNSIPSTSDHSYIKVHVFQEGHKNWWNLDRRFDIM